MTQRGIAQPPLRGLFSDRPAVLRLARISHQEPVGTEANARRQECRAAIHRARLPPYCTLGDVHKLLPRAAAPGPFSLIHRGRGEKCGLVGNAPLPPVVLSRARPPPATERGLGWGHNGPPVAARLLAWGNPHESHYFRNLISLIPQHLLHLTPSDPGTSPYSRIGAFAPTKGIIIMTTNAQIKANRKNAKKSTGPRTEEGKTRVAKNALKHGLLARDTVLPGEDPADFDSQLSALEADIQPANSLEFELVRQIADAQWRMRRLTRLETGFLAAALDETRRYMEKRRPDELRPGYDGETLLLGTAMLDRTQAFVHLARYDGHLSRRFFRAVKQLRDLRH